MLEAKFSLAPLVYRSEPRYLSCVCRFSSVVASTGNAPMSDDMQHSVVASNALLLLSRGGRERQQAKVCIFVGIQVFSSP